MGRELRVSPNATLHIVLALSMPTQVDGVRVHSDVHEVVDNLTLNVVLHTIDQETSAHIHHLYKG